MQAIVDILERRVADALALIGVLRERTVALERELASAPLGAPPDQACDRATSEELERLRAERTLVRERVRALIREIDRVSW